MSGAGIYVKKILDADLKEMAVLNCLREGRILKKDGEIEFDFVTVDGIGLPSYPCTMWDGGYPKRINDVINMDTRPDDIILVTYPKSGTHWMTEILHMLVKGRAEYAKERLVKAVELVSDLSMVNRLPSPRVLNIHLPYKWFPMKHIENGGKIIHCTRNPKDVYVSMFHHCSTGLEFGQKTKGMTWTQFFDNCVIGKDCMYGTWFDNEKELDQAKRNNKNIYTVHYEKMTENLNQEIKALATFLELHVSSDLLKDISRKCLFPSLKQAYDEIKELPSDGHKFVPDMRNVNIFRKGLY